jgi:hypothetical protein
MVAGRNLTDAQGTAFVYQGKLTDNGFPATGLYDMKFRVYDAPTLGNQLPPGIPVEVKQTAVPVTNGLFTVVLDFDPPGTIVVFTGGRRWLEMDVRTNNNTIPYVTLVPRTELFPTPYAIYAENAATSADAWRLTGNSGTTPGVNFLGTTDGQPLEIRANGVGIGTTAPSAKLHVVSSGASEAVRGIHASSGTYGALAVVKEPTQVETGLRAGVYGSVGLGPIDYAGFFDGRVYAALNTNGDAVTGIHLPSGTYGALASVTQVGEFTYPTAVYGFAGEGGYAGQFDGQVTVSGAANSVFNSSNASSDPSSAAVRGASNAGFGVRGESSGVGVSGYNYASAHYAHLATPSFAGLFGGDVRISGHMPGQQANLLVNGDLSVSEVAYAKLLILTSDRNMKTNFAPVDPREILRRVIGLNVQRWSFTNDVAAVHVGPMAQDFYAAFGVGLDDKHICTVDAEGVGHPGAL